MRYRSILFRVFFLKTCRITHFTLPKITYNTNTAEALNKRLRNVSILEYMKSYCEHINKLLVKIIFFLFGSSNEDSSSFRPATEPRNFGKLLLSCDQFLTL
jgi:hypothetical protein